MDIADRILFLGMTSVAETNTHFYKAPEIYTPPTKNEYEVAEALGLATL